MNAAEPRPLPAFPPPPYRIPGLIPLYRRIAGRIAIVLVSLFLAAILIGYLGVSREGRSLILDTLLSLGIGAPIEGATVNVGQCDYYHTTGRYGTWGNDCDLTVRVPVEGGGVEEYFVSIDVSHEEDATRYHEAAHLFGAVGLRWPAGVMADRWMQAGLLFIALAFFGFMLHFVWTMMREDRNLRRAGQKGRFIPVDLLHARTTGEGDKAVERWLFSYVDGAGRRHCRKAQLWGGALALDGMVTRGVAIVAPSGRPCLLLGNFAPLAFDAATTSALASEAAESRAVPRPKLPPFADEPADPPARLALIRSYLGKGRSGAERAYVLAWRLLWDFVDVDTANEALKLRHQAAMKLGPKHARAALAVCRKLHVAENLPTPQRLS